ncbi:MAG: hypothetical protein ABI432_17855 [Flavobacteriales bacterium]
MHSVLAFNPRSSHRDLPPMITRWFRWYRFRLSERQVSWLIPLLAFGCLVLLAMY